MPYKLTFKNKFTKNRWVENVNTFRTKKDAKSTAEYIKNQHDENGKKWEYVGRLTNKDNYGARRKFLRKEGWNYFRLINVSYDTVIYHIYARKSK